MFKCLMDLMVYFVDFQLIRTPWLIKRLTLDQLQTETVAKILLGIAARRFAMIKTQVRRGNIDTIWKILQNASETEAGNDTDIVMIISLDGNAKPLASLKLWSVDFRFQMLERRVRSLVAGSYHPDCQVKFPTEDVGFEINIIYIYI